MATRKIKCGGCSDEGEIEIIGLQPKVTPELLFRYLGHHEFTGRMYFLCPHCKREVVVNPDEILSATTMISSRAYLPPYASTEIIRTGRGSFRLI